MFFGILFLLLGIVGLFIYEYIRIKPNYVHFSNITSNSVTVSWNTKTPTAGSVRVFVGKTILPVSIFHSSDRYFDTRDITEAELEAVESTASNIVKSDDLIVSIDDFETEVKVVSMGEYYTHHVTVTGLNPETEYSFAVGDTYIFREVKDIDDSVVVTTLDTPEAVESPIPAYGSIKNA